MLKKILLFFGMAAGIISGHAQTERERWVDSVFARLAGHEKIGQLFILRTKAPATESEFKTLAGKIKRFHPAGIELAGPPYGDVKTLIDRLQASTHVPLLFGADETQLLADADSARAFPTHLQLAAFTTDTLVNQVYDFASGWLTSLGITYTTGLRVEPLIVSSSNWQQHLQQVGDEKKQIEMNALRWYRSLHRNGRFAVPHFHPAPNVLSVTNGDPLRLPETDEFFFAGWPEVRMIRSTDFQFQVRFDDHEFPAAQSGQFIRDVIRQQLQYKGLLAYAAAPEQEEDYISIFMAGNDLITTCEVTDRQLTAVAKALRKNKLLKVRLDQAIRRVLALKYDLRPPPVQPPEPWRWPAADQRLLLRRVFEQSVTIAQNKGNVLPLKNLDFQKVALITMGKSPDREFEVHLKKYVPAVTGALLEMADTASAKNVIGNVSAVVVAVYDPSFTTDAVRWLKSVTSGKTVVVCHMAGIAHIGHWSAFDAVLAGFTPVAEVQRALVQNLFGVEPGRGVLPLSLPVGFAIAPGIAPLPHFAFSEPEAAEMDSETLQKIEPIVREAIAGGATPGAHIVIARHGKIVYQKSFGTLTYAAADPVTDSTLYDLASVTKVSATLQAIMFLHEKKIIDLNKKASVYLPELKGTNKEDMVLRDILTHQAGLWPFLPFWADTMKDSIWLPGYYRQVQSPDYPWPVAENLFAHQAMKDSLWNWIIRSKIREKKPRTPYDYRYSDMGFYILHHVAEKLLNQPLDEFLRQNLYEPLGAFSLGYLPRNRYPATQIAPTEHDKLFRKGLLTGYVHDQGAAMHGGVAGHAGLFGTGLDLAKLGQLWLNRGNYGDTRFFNAETVDYFTDRQFASSRRGLGWDKPLLNDWNSPTAFAASPLTFGHTGFTGTCVWVDPVYDLVYVFLSNRVHPDMNNNKLLQMNIRPRIQEVVYQSVFNYSLYRPAARN